MTPTNLLPFKFLPNQTHGAEPIWENGLFSIGDEEVSVLEYSSNLAGWNDQLTAFHEENAGENHFIDCASRQHATSQLNEYLTEPNPIIMEIGCSSGHLLEKLSKEVSHATLIGADIVYKPLLELAKKYTNIPMLRFDLVNCPLPDNCLDAIVLLNVLEHIEDDVTALKQMKRILKPGGIAIIEVPAGPHLYDIYDKQLLHFRRYRLNDLAKQVKQCGFKILKKSHLGFFIYPGFWLVKQRNKRLLNEPQEKSKQIIEKNIRDTGSNKLLHRLMKLELFLGNWINFPTGIRCLLTCVKE